MLRDRVIRHGRVEPDLWNYWGVDEGEQGPPPAGPVIVPLATWKAGRAALRARREPVGVWLAPADDPAELLADLRELPLIGVHFPKFADGRGYSTATLLRGRYGYRGELRAFGDVGRDQLFYLRRCGFDAFSLPPHRDPEAALASLQDFSVRYQASVDEALPLFRRRHAAEVAP